MKDMKKFGKNSFFNQLGLFARGFLKDERGQSTTEYILILAVVVMIAMKFRDKFGKTMESGMTTLDSKMQGAFEDIQ